MEVWLVPVTLKLSTVFEASEKLQPGIPTTGRGVGTRAELRGTGTRTRSEADRKQTGRKLRVFPSTSQSPSTAP